MQVDLYNGCKVVLWLSMKAFELSQQSRDATKFAAIFSIINLVHAIKSKHKGSPYSITERRVPQLIPVMAVSLQVT